MFAERERETVIAVGGSSDDGGAPGQMTSFRTAMARMVTHCRPRVICSVSSSFRRRGTSDIPRVKREVHEKASPMVPEGNASVAEGSLHQTSNA